MSRNRNFYHLWYKIIQRCTHPHNPNFKRYGARGISVCERWRTFKNFEQDMKPSYEKGLWIERIDNNGNYCPENCRWATIKEQCNNRRTNRFVTFDGMKKTIAQWAEHFGIKGSTLRQRFYVYNWSLERCFSPVGGQIGR